MSKAFHAERKVFDSAKRRCENPQNQDYRYYGGRGIEVRFHSFEDFLAYLGPRPSPEYSLDRIDNNGHYERGNLRWTTMSVQNRNQTRSRTFLINGSLVNAVDRSVALGGNKCLITCRINTHGWCETCAFMKPIGGTCEHRKPSESD